MNKHVDSFIKRWRSFAAQPGNTHIALAAALLSGLILMVALADSDPDGTEQAAFDTPDEATGSMISDTASDSNNNGVSDTSTLDFTETPATDTAGIDAPAPEHTIAANADEPVVDTTVIAVNRLAIILDDIGYNAEAGERAVNLPGAITYAVLPFTPHGKMLAQMAHDAGKEVMLHAPMSNLAGMALGEGGLTLTLTEAEFTQTLRAAIADIPHIAGVNNHTGSELTAVEQPMQWVMRELKAQDLFFVDSMTTGKSVAARVALENQVPTMKRHVFLDNEASHEAIDREFKRALDIARSQGFAVAIGHPYPETLEYLEQALDDLPALEITLVPASALLTFP
ncbi:divergent polysaccharide deacetylase family protein [Pseudohongiella acticola]|jgi:uncharacterized protein|uniref:divergent polysaccharide deacetylase family protein n=1 Tax=Pseudohongiella acticola TaxID=1524254 RepID=UPI0009F230ED|nr:divergent polysaccharide deacetylase family protein [Pseudohongiella acticola]